MTPRRATSVGKYATILGPCKAVKSRRAALLIKMVEDQRRKHKEDIQDRHGRTEHEAAKFAEDLSSGDQKHRQTPEPAQTVYRSFSVVIAYI